MNLTRLIKNENINGFGFRGIRFNNRRREKENRLNQVKREKRFINRKEK